MAGPALLDPGPREEVVLIHRCDRQASALHVFAILRDATGRATGLAPRESSDGDSILADRFVNLLEALH